MLKFFRYISGYLRVVFYGEYSEKILNLAAKNRISLWETKLVKKGIETSISIKNFRRLPQIIRKSSIRVHIIKKKGLPFKIDKNRKRTGIIIGFALMLFILKFMSGYIWMIDVVGNDAVQKEEIINACAKIGIKEGVRKDKINSKIKREELLLELDSLAWASLNVEGSLLTVNVSEIKKGDNSNSCICNLKAKADGIIKKIDVTSGNCVVKVGDTVKKGDILVSGILEKLNRTDFVHSAGSITAVTERSITVEGDYETVIKTENGKIKNKSVLKFFGLKIPLFIGKEKGSYNSTLKESSITIFDRELPIILYSKQFRFTDEYKITLDFEQLSKKLMEKVDKILKEEKVTDYEITNREFTQNEKGLSFTVIVSATENIAYREALLVGKEE